MKTEFAIKRSDDKIPIGSTDGGYGDLTVLGQIAFASSLPHQTVSQSGVQGDFVVSGRILVKDSNNVTRVVIGQLPE